MNLLCPSCQKMLTIEEQYAGQMMRCPLCNGTFVVPSLAPMPAAVTVGSSQPQHEDAAPATAFDTLETVTAEKAVTPEPEATAGRTTPAGYTHTHSLILNPKVLPWIAPVFLVLNFFLLFFTWDGLYPGGHAVYTQSAWGSMFGPFSSAEVGQKVLRLEQPLVDNRHASWLLILYLFVFLAALIVAIASLLLPRLQIKLPPAVQRLWPWKSALIGGLTALALVLLLLQLLVGLGLENAAERVVENEFADQAAKAETPEERQMVDIRRGAALDAMHPERGVAVGLTVLYGLIALAGAGLDLWMERRSNRPRPRVEFAW